MLDDAQLRTLEERLRLPAGAGGAPRRRSSSRSRAGQARRRAGGADPRRPRPRRGWRTSTCRSSRSGAPRRRSPARRAWSRWPTGCSATRPSSRSRPRRRSWTPTRASPMPQAALDGARAILAERFSEDADLIGELRERMWTRGPAGREGARGQGGGGREVRRLLRLRRAVHRSCPRTGSSPCSAARRRTSSTSSWSRRSRAESRGPSSYEGDRRPPVRHRRPRARPATSGWSDTVRWAWRTRILVHLGIDLRLRLRQAAEDEAVRVFAANLRDLLLAAPAGTRATMGLDPGFRTGVKVAVVDATGKVVATDVIYPHVPANKWDESLATLAAAGQGAHGRADRDRQRHGVPRDRQAGRVN